MSKKTGTALTAVFLLFIVSLSGILNPVVLARSETEIDQVNRLFYLSKVKKLLKKYNSPLIESSRTFIEVAEENDLDWRFLVAIAGIESGFGKFIPYGSYNPFGFGNGQSRFDSFDESIRVVGKYLAKMKAKGLNTAEKLAPIYTPPNFKNWTAAVNFFMEEVEK